jgi:hypothetical protein
MMKNIVQLIREHKFIEAEEQIDNTVPLIMEKKLLEIKKAVAAKMCEQMKSASQKMRGELTEDEIEESIDPTEIHNGPAPTGQRVNSADKGDKQPPNTTVVPKNNLKEDEEELDEARVNIVKARIRGGKVQRRKKVSNVPGMTLRGGQLKRMSAAERRRRKLGARKGKAKRKAKLSRSLMKRKRSLQRRKSLGL